MKEIGAYLARTHFSALLEQAERGDTIIITKNGRPVAQLGPIKAKQKPVKPADAMKKLLSMKTRLRGMSLRQLIDDGRR